MRHARTSHLLAAGVAILLVLACVPARAGGTDDGNGLSEPPGRVSWRIKDKVNGHYFHVIPYESVSSEGHAKCRELIGGDHDEPGKGFMFFIVIIDNRQGEEPVKFNAFGGDACFYYYPPKKPNAPPKDPAPEPQKYGLVSLSNFFADPANTPADKAGYKEIKAMFKTSLTVPPGQYGWSLACIRDTFTYDLARNKVTWAIPGELPQIMQGKKFSKGLLKKAEVKLFED